MELTIKEVNTYINLVSENKAEKITCPLNETDIVIAKIDENDNVFFYCMTCKTTFYPGVNLIQKIRAYIDAYLFLKKKS